MEEVKEHDSEQDVTKDDFQKSSVSAAAAPTATNTDDLKRKISEAQTKKYSLSN